VTCREYILFSDSLFNIIKLINTRIYNGIMDTASVNFRYLIFSDTNQTITMLNMTGATSGAATTYPPETPEFIPGFKW